MRNHLVRLCPKLWGGGGGAPVPRAPLPMLVSRARPFTNRYAGKGSGRLTLSSLFLLSQQVVNCGSISVGVNC